MDFKILSWDVGIKNLAYCMLQKNEDNFKILKWGVINLVEHRQKCQFNLRTGVQCSEIAKFCICHKDKIPLFNNFEEGIVYTCTKHKDKLIPEVEDVSIKTTNKKNKKLPHKCIHCDNESDYDLCNTDYHWCKQHYEKKGKSFIKKIKIKKVTIVSCNKQPLQELSEKLFFKLDKEFSDFTKVNEVIIENQPSLRNPTMKTLASILYSYFIMRGIIDKDKIKSLIEEVKFVSPSNKLKVNEVNTNKILKEEKEKSKVYKLTKKLGVKYCKALIDKEDIINLEKYKKKDDMCDAFLQGFHYLFSPISVKYFEKLKIIGFDEEDKKPKK